MLVGKRINHVKAISAAQGRDADGGEQELLHRLGQPRLVGVGTISAVVKSEDMLRAEIRRTRADAPRGFIGMNLMAAINQEDFQRALQIAFEEGISFIVQGAGISRSVVRACRDAGVPFAGIVSSGRLAAMYEKWGAEFLVAEGAEAGGHIGDVGHPLPALLADVLAHSSLPTIAAGGIDAGDLPAVFAAGAAGAQLATRFLACSEGDSHPSFKQMHLAKGEADINLCPPGGADGVRKLADLLGREPKPLDDLSLRMKLFDEAGERESAAKETTPAQVEKGAREEGKAVKSPRQIARKEPAEKKTPGQKTIRIKVLSGDGNIASARDVLPTP